jgi:hypothetical protein
LKILETIHAKITINHTIIENQNREEINSKEYSENILEKYLNSSFSLGIKKINPHISNSK